MPDPNSTILKSLEMTLSKYKYYNKKNNVLHKNVVSLKIPNDLVTLHLNYSKYI